MATLLSRGAFVSNCHAVLRLRKQLYGALLQSTEPQLLKPAEKKRPAERGLTPVKREPPVYIE